MTNPGRWDDGDPGRKTRAQVMRYLVELRIDQGLKQKDVAERMGIGQQRVSSIEMSTEWPVHVLDRYARAVGYRLVMGVVPIEDDDDGEG